MSRRLRCRFCGAEVTEEKVTEQGRWATQAGRRGYFCPGCGSFVVVQRLADLLSRLRLRPFV